MAEIVERAVVGRDVGVPIDCGSRWDGRTYGDWYAYHHYGRPLPPVMGREPQEDSRCRRTRE